MEETMSNWSCVRDFMKTTSSLNFGKYVSYWMQKTPRRTLHSLSYYKFASRMIGSSKRVLDVGCNEGLGTYLLAKECGYAKGIDLDEEAINSAKANYSQHSFIDFSHEDLLQNGLTSKAWDSVVSFDVIEHIFPDHEDAFFKAVINQTKDEGLVILGTPSLISQQFASECSKKGHVNIYSPQRLEETMKRYFTYVFLFAANDEVVHTGFLPLAHYLIAIGCKPKQ